MPQLTRIADTNTTIPGGGGAAFNDFEAPVIEDSIVAFWSWDGIGLVEGVYYGNDAASVQALVDRSTQIPGRPETFGIIAGINNGGGPSIDGRQVVFRASSNVEVDNVPFLANGLYVATILTDDVQIVVENTFDVPQTGPFGPTAAFLDFYNPSFEDGVVAYRGDTVEGSMPPVNRSSIFLTRSGAMAPELVFDASDQIDPDQTMGSSAFSLNEPSLTANDEVVFAALVFATPNSRRRWGVYRATAAGFPIAPEVDGRPDEMPAAGDPTRIGGATNALTGRPLADGDRVLFYAERQDATPGLFFLESGNPNPIEVATEGTPIPNGGGAGFDSILPGNWALEGDRVLFVGRGAGVVGIYEWELGVGLGEWLSNRSTGDLEPGRPAGSLTGLKLAPGGLDDGLVAFTAFFDDSSAAIYRSGGPAGSSPMTPILPFTAGDGGRFDFANIQVVRDGLQFFDPVVAIGYEFVVTAGPAVTSLALPLELGDGSYEIWVWDGEAFVLDGTTTAEGEFAVYELSEPSSRFQVRGIEPSAGLDPADPLAFPAGLAFASDGAVDFSMTALPEPGAGAATAAALLGLAAVGRCRRR